RLLEVLELETSVKPRRALLELPIRHVSEELSRLFLRQGRHAAPAGNASLRREDRRAHGRILSSWHGSMERVRAFSCASRQGGREEREEHVCPWADRRLPSSG